MAQKWRGEGIAEVSLAHAPSGRIKSVAHLKVSLSSGNCYSYNDSDCQGLTCNCVAGRYASKLRLTLRLTAFPRRNRSAYATHKAGQYWSGAPEGIS